MKDTARLSKLRQTSQAAFAASSFSSWLLFINDEDVLSYVALMLLCEVSVSHET